MKLPKIDKLAMVVLSFFMFFYMIISTPWVMKEWRDYNRNQTFQAAHPFYTKDGCPVTVVDGCEYIGDYTQAITAHKGNCTNKWHELHNEIHQ